MIINLKKLVRKTPSGRNLRFISHAGVCCSLRMRKATNSSRMVYRISGDIKCTMIGNFWPVGVNRGITSNGGCQLKKDITLTTSPELVNAIIHPSIHPKVFQRLNIHGEQERTTQKAK